MNRRLSKYALDPDNKKMYRGRAEQWSEYTEKWQSYHEKQLAKAEKSGIIDSKNKKAPIISMNNNSIEQPIEQRNTGKGNPNAVLTYGVSLNNRQSDLLNKLPDYDSRCIVLKKTVKLSDLSALTAYTGDEFAMFTKGSDRLIIRGNKVSVNIDIKAAQRLAEQGYRWSGHTHPGSDISSMFASGGDVTILEQFKQKSSVIYNSKGQFLTFGKE